MPMTEQEKALAREYRRKQYREQKDALDKIKRDKKSALRTEKDKALWGLIKKADDLEDARCETAHDLP